MNEQDIIDEIKKKVSSVGIKGKSNPTLTERYPSWYIGITDNPEERKSSHKSNGKDVRHWRSWPASSGANARNVEKRFLDLGMRGDTGGGRNPKYVYIY